MYKVGPRTVVTHRGVSLVTTGEAQGSDDDEYKWYVELKSGWCFGRGRNEGGSSLFFNTVEDFTDAEPMTRKEYDARA